MARQQLLGLAGERGDQQRRPTRVGGGVGVRHLRGQQAAGHLGRHRRRRHEDDGLDPRVDRRADRVEPVAVVLPEITKPP